MQELAARISHFESCHGRILTGLQPHHHKWPISGEGLFYNTDASMLTSASSWRQGPLSHATFHMNENVGLVNPRAKATRAGLAIAVARGQSVPLELPWYFRNASWTFHASSTFRALTRMEIPLEGNSCWIPSS
jgi:hypothetical protein